MAAFLVQPRVPTARRVFASAALFYHVLPVAADNGKTQQELELDALYAENQKIEAAQKATSALWTGSSTPEYPYQCRLEKPSVPQDHHANFTSDVVDFGFTSTFQFGTGCVSPYEMFTDPGFSTAVCDIIRSAANLSMTHNDTYNFTDVEKQKYLDAIPTTDCYVTRVHDMNEYCDGPQQKDYSVDYQHYNSTMDFKNVRLNLTDWNGNRIFGNNVSKVEDVFENDTVASAGLASAGLSGYYYKKPKTPACTWNFFPHRCQLRGGG
jgi:hypothetical protein